MKILAFDSTAKVSSVALTDGERLLAQYNIDFGLTQSELLLPMAESILGALHLSFSDIEIYACTTGPGSFTGVRIGAALVKGLAFGKNLPCVEVSTLDSLAENISSLSGILVPCMDARRNQVYNAVFSSDGHTLTRLTPDRAISLDALADELKAYEGQPVYISGDGYDVAVKALSDKGISVKPTPSLLIPQSAYSAARVAYRKYLFGKIVSDTALSPSYLRVPQAERERLERLSNK